MDEDRRLVDLLAPFVYLYLCEQEHENHVVGGRYSLLRDEVLK